MHIECDFDGVVHRFAEDALDRLELAHAITVHKAQGASFSASSFRSCGAVCLDRTLIYTALTRAVDQVVFVGDRKALTNAIEAPPRSKLRQVGFQIRTSGDTHQPSLPETSS